MRAFNGIFAFLLFIMGVADVLAQKPESPPFSISVVPAWSYPSARGISMASNTLDTFYVISPMFPATLKRYLKLRIAGDTTRCPLNCKQRTVTW
jgi:hypothetical protein